MKKLLVTAVAVGVIGALAMVLMSILLVVAALGGSSASAAAGTCPVPGGNPGGVFDEAYLAHHSVADLSSKQIASAATIVAVGEQQKMPARGIIIALAVANQESHFQNYANDGQGRDLAPEQTDVERSMTFPHDAVGSDHGSVNAFQQQYPWWGTLEQLMDPPTAARLFYESLNKVPGWQLMSVTRAANRVQKSAYPGAYADDEPLANELYTKLAGAGSVPTAPASSAAAGTSSSAPAAAPVSFVCGASGGGGAVSAGGWSLPLNPGSYTLTSGYGPRKSPTGGSGTFHAGLDFGAPARTPIRAAADGTVTFAGFNSGGFGNLVIIHTAPNIDTYYAHQVNGGIRVATGDTVTAGQLIGAVGATGDSTGNHLHFEVRIDGATTDPLPFLQQQGLNSGALP